MPLLDTPVRLGVQLQPQHAPYTAFRDAVRRLEDLGVDILFNWDHFFPLSGDRDGMHFDSWTMLAAWAEQSWRRHACGCNVYAVMEGSQATLLATEGRSVTYGVCRSLVG